MFAEHVLEPHISMFNICLESTPRVFAVYVYAVYEYDYDAGCFANKVPFAFQDLEATVGERCTSPAKAKFFRLLKNGE